MPLPGAPAHMLSAYGSVWVMPHRDSSLVRLDPASGKVTARVDTGVLGCGDLVGGANSVWVTGCGVTPGLVRVNAQTNRVTGLASYSGLGPAFFRDELWIGSLATSQSGDELVRAGPDELDAARRVPVPGLLVADGVVAVAGSIWVGDRTAAVVYRVDPDREVVQAAVPMPATPDTGYLTEHDEAPWYIDAAQGLLVQIDPQNGSPKLLAVRLARPTEYWGLAASTAPGPPGRLWVRNGDDEAWLVDTRGDRVLRRIATANGRGGDLQQVGKFLWVTGFGNNQVERIPLDSRPR